MTTVTAGSRTGNSIIDHAPAAYGRRRTDRPRLPEWLAAPLLPSEEPRDGALLPAGDLRVGDYLFEFHESDGTASWLRVGRVRPHVGGVFVTYGLRGGVTIRFDTDRQLWTLPVEDAAVLAYRSSDRVVSAWGGAEDAMLAHLRSFASVRDLVAGWRFESPSVADAVTAWELLREADEANRTDVPPTLGSVAR